MNLKINLKTIQKSDEEVLFSIFLTIRPDLMPLISIGNPKDNPIIKQQFDLSQSFKDEKELQSRFLILQGEQVVGHLFLRHNKEYDEVVSIGILPPFRNLGVGSYLIKKIKDEAMKNHRGLKLKVAWYNNDAKRLYERLGFREVGNKMVYSEMLFDK